MEEKEAEKELKKIKEEVLACQKCPLSKERVYPVIGEGSHRAKIMFIGEAPGEQESKTGRPFCGRAGKVLDKLLAGIDLKRSDVYITNLLKDRPPANRDPLLEEIGACSPFLERQIRAISPRVICPLGRYSMKFIMEKFGLKDRVEPISKIHGKVFSVSGLFQNIKIISFYHPAVATYNPLMLKILKEDFEVLRQFSDHK